MPGSPSDGTTATPQRTRTVAHSSSQGERRLRTTTPRSRCPGSRHAPSRAETCARAEELERRALATAEAARAAWAAAHARVELGRILAAAGDTDTAARLYRNVLAWSELPRQHGPRESLFVALAEDPGAAAAAGLADLGDGRAATAAVVAPA